jgi:hypothetical protein
MKDIAHISFEGGGLIVPAQTPYDREVLIEHVEASTRRHGLVHLDINNRRWEISVNADSSEVCGACSRYPSNSTCQFDGRILCAECARHALQ